MASCQAADSGAQDRQECMGDDGTNLLHWVLTYAVY